jgi:hypothetical protein
MDKSVKVEPALLKKNEDGSLEVCGIPLKKSTLSRLMKITSRIGVLYKCLSMSHRMYLNLVIKLVDKVTSKLLARVLAPMILKLLEAIKDSPKLMMDVLGRVRYWMIAKGWEKAEKESNIARKWGNKTAYKWAKDARFARYLTIMNMIFWESQGNLQACGK